MIFNIAYPSGGKATVYGEWRGPYPVAEDDSILSPMIEITKACWVQNTLMEKGQILMLDPRAVIVNRHGGRIWEPSILDSRQPEWVHEWLAENPAWPPEDEEN